MTAYSRHGAPMKHASVAALEPLADLLSEIRTRGVKEPSPGIFYRKGKAWIHFHEDDAGLFADIKAGSEWRRFRVTEPEERASFLDFIDHGPCSTGQP